MGQSNSNTPTNPECIGFVIIQKNNSDLIEIQKFIESKGYKVINKPSDDIDKQLLVIE